MTLFAEEKGSLLRYSLAIGFGFIHGMGFSSYLRSLLGDESSIFQALLPFNLGLELGQIMIVLVVLVVAFFVIELGRVPQRTWNFVLSGIIAGMALSLIMNNELFKQMLSTGFSQ